MRAFDCAAQDVAFVADMGGRIPQSQSMTPDAISKHNATVALLLRVEASRFPQHSDSFQHYETQARRFDAAGPREVAAASPTKYYRSGNRL
jgi:hypothetical protein